MTALMDAVATATEDVPRLYPVGSVPASPIYPYGVYSAQLLEEDVRTLDGNGAIRWAQVVFQAFGRTAASAIDLTERFRSELVGTWLTVDGYVVGPFASELRPTPPTRDPDAAGVIGVTTTLTATAEES